MRALGIVALTLAVVAAVVVVAIVAHFRYRTRDVGRDTSRSCRSFDDELAELRELLGEAQR